ncbi:MAG TPA: NFACT RNA binding domain-containing protein [Pyrinomonadaceae bacterium]|nr:NFACT RNA binding domain-containing protein [Pyrinomonadaceae bacterium]
MHEETLSEVVAELDHFLVGRFLGRVYQLSDVSLAIDYGLKRDGYLFISVDPNAPRLYLVKRSFRELEKGSTSLSPFAQAMRTALAGGNVGSITKDEHERIVRFSLRVTDELGDSRERALVAQLTGRSANLFLLDAEGKITHALRAPKGDGQQVGGLYSPPPRQAKAVVEEIRISRGKFPTLSAAIDEHYRSLEIDQAFESRTARLASKARKDIAKQRKLKANLETDLRNHGSPEEHKRLGDLLLANISNAERVGDKVKLRDYYADDAPLIKLDLDSNISLSEAASEAFARYSKSKRAIEELGSRLVQIERQLTELEEKQTRLLEAIAARDEKTLAEFEAPKEKKPVARKKSSAGLPGMRRYLSSDGYEVIIGRTARDNDRLTFREARPNDLWLHAGDYPGSHVIVRNSSRKEIPHRTIVEAAQLAAKFSQASKDAKVNIHYTQRKFLSKPKGAAPGLVRLSKFRSITVEPAENIERM